MYWLDPKPCHSVLWFFGRMEWLWCSAALEREKERGCKIGEDDWRLKGMETQMRCSIPGSNSLSDRSNDTTSLELLIFLITVCPFLELSSVVSWMLASMLTGKFLGTFLVGKPAGKNWRLITWYDKTLTVNAMVEEERTAGSLNAATSTAGFAFSWGVRRVTVRRGALRGMQVEARAGGIAVVLQQQQPAHPTPGGNDNRHWQTRSLTLCVCCRCELRSIVDDFLSGIPAAWPSLNPSHRVRWVNETMHSAITGRRHGVGLTFVLRWPWPAVLRYQRRKRIGLQLAVTLTLKWQLIRWPWPWLGFYGYLQCIGFLHFIASCFWNVWPPLSVNVTKSNLQQATRDMGRVTCGSDTYPDGDVVENFFKALEKLNLLDLRS